MGPDLIRRLAEATRLDGNPEIDGWLLEMWFFACLRTGGVRLFSKGSEKCQIWTESKVRILDTNAAFAILDDATWYKPLAWNQG